MTLQNSFFEKMKNRLNELKSLWINLMKGMDIYEEDPWCFINRSNAQKGL